MAACSVASLTTAGVPALVVLRTVSSNIGVGGSQVSFSGRSLCRSRLSASTRTWESQTKLARGNAKTVCFAETSFIISLCTGVSLFLGRVALLPFQRAQVAKAGLPQQNGVSHFEAGDTRAQEVVLQTNDPAGFTIADVLAWGAIGHAVGFFILATSTNGYDPTF